MGCCSNGSSTHAPSLNDPATLRAPSGPRVVVESQLMIPGPGQYLSLLMGAATLSDGELEALGVEILERFGSGVRGLLVPAKSVEPYKQRVRERMTPGFWNDLVGSTDIFFLFKMPDGTLEELTLSDDNKETIAALCSALNGDPLERTRDLPAYFATNPFYREAMIAYYGVAAERPGTSR